MRRLLLSLSIIALILGLTSCGDDSDSTKDAPDWPDFIHTNDHGQVTNVDGHLECSGIEVVVSDYDVTDEPTNRYYGVQVRKLFESAGADTRAFGYDQEKDAIWIQDLTDQLDQLLVSMNPKLDYVDMADAGTKVNFPADCWVENESGDVIMGDISDDARLQTTTTAPEQPKYADYASSKEFRSEAFKFSVLFPAFDSNDVIEDLDMPADSKTTWYKTYYGTVYAAQKPNKLIYCRDISSACRLHSSFNVDVYPDNAVNRQALEDYSYDTCANVTFTGVPGRDCKRLPNEYSSYYTRDVLIYRNGKIYHLSGFGDIPDETLYDGFVASFGFNDV